MVAWEGSLSDEIPIRQGVRQGSKGSPMLYKVFINDLLKALEEASYALCVGETSVTCPTVADDVLLLTDSHEKAQELLHFVHEHVCHNRYCINPT